MISHVGYDALISVKTLSTFNPQQEHSIVVILFLVVVYSHLSPPLSLSWTVDLMPVWSGPSLGGSSLVFQPPCSFGRSFKHGCDPRICRLFIPSIPIFHGWVPWYNLLPVHESLSNVPRPPRVMSLPFNCLGNK
jgi:hypothetical protein